MKFYKANKRIRKNKNNYNNSNNNNISIKLILLNTFSIILTITQKYANVVRNFTTKRYLCNIYYNSTCLAKIIKPKLNKK